ncbi:hypothetical protein APICC_06804 [Apis cerana cerana]|uniref:Uncharacterized protein n=1 Tax=Apis cerana cerana TaxID=94128 RepID=A0A2A3EQ35_APICC|nr:hypothetical protein APICC_06804 [Apis cerana cerana]
MARGGKKGAFPLQRSNSTDTVATYHQLVPCSTGRRFGSLELIESDRFAAGYNRARVTELNEEEGAGEEVSEIHESVFVDIPTLVAVLIKPDNNPDESSVHIEEIYSDEVVDESSNDVEFIEGDRSYERREIYEVNARKTGQEVDKGGRERKRKFRKQDSVDAIPALTNLHASRKFGSVEAIQRRDPAFSFERSHTSLEKPLRPASSTIPDRVAKKLNDIREVCGGAASQSNGCRARSFARKPSLENVRRKSSKDSSSSSSKDEQISTGRGDKPSSSRKNSLEQESSSILRNHTPIQRVKRAEIVAAVTERLYSSKRSAEDSPGMRSPTGEATADGATKSVARLKLQEISRKMLGKRRRVSVDTQTDCSRTVRMRDTASLTETSPIARRDVAISTDHRQVCEKPVWDKGFGPVLRVKEMATSTDKPSTVVSVVRCRDVGSSATDLEDYDCGLHSPRNDSGILSDDGQNYYAGSSSNPSSVEVSDFCQEGERGRVACTESSTNTSAFSTCRSFAVQTSRRTDQPTQFACSRRCCVQQQQSGERSVISISLPDSVSITIESRGSRISTREKDCGASKDESAQTKARRDEEETSPPLSRSRDNRTASTPSQIDCKVFRIENIFHDPNNAVERSYSSRVDSKGSPRGAGAEERARIRNSITLRNSLGTSNDTNHDHGFSDDSLDYNESNASSDDPTTSLLTKVKQGMGRERENFCPPDVVAHTKKNCPKSIETDPKNEPVADFKHDRGGLPTRNPGKLAEIDAHGPESLTIFGGKPFRSYEGEMDESDNVSPNNSGRKKKVSFSSSTTVSEKRFDSIGILKPIIKRRRRRNAAADESPNPVHSSNEETEDSQQEVRGGLISKGSWREKTRSGSSEEGKEELAFEEEESSRKKNRRRVKFFAFDESSENTCSESESYENVEEEEEEEEEEEGRNVLEEYLSEAVTLMRNLNSGTSTCRASLAHRGRSGTPPPWDLHDRSKFTIDRRGEDSTNPARIGDFSIDASTEISYERCVKGIQRLEDCIRRIDRHNELLKEKYGVDCESAGSRPDLANPSTDPHRASNHDDDDDDSKVLSGTREVGSRSSPSVAGRKDDLERKIFDQLMNVANSIRYRRSNVGPETPQSPTNAAKFRETEEPRRGEVRKLGNLSLEESWNDSGRQDAFATYEITGNLSVGRTCRFTERNSDTDRNSLDEDSLPPRRAFDRTIFDDEQDELSSTSSYAFPTKREARTRDTAARMQSAAIKHVIVLDHSVY